MKEQDRILIDRLILVLEKMNLKGYSDHITNRRRMIANTLLFGVLRGVGFSFGFTVLGAASIVVLRRFFESRMPEISGFPMPEIPLPALPDQPEDLPAITLPPLQAPPLTTPKETPLQATGATARVQQPELLTDLSALRKSYPAVARRNGWEGTVTLRLRITANGRLDSAEVIQSSGYKVLDNEAAKMLRRARFRNGPGELIQSITYSLEAHSARPRH